MGHKGLAVVVEVEEGEQHKEWEDKWHEKVEVGSAWDDVTGLKLDPKEVVRARREEIGWMRNKGVYRKVPRAVAVRNGWKIVKSRWVDINKGDDTKRKYRSRVVAMEFNRGGQEIEEDMFAGTPPLEAMRMLISEAATVEENQDYTKVIVVADVKKAFYEARARLSLIHI